MRVLLLRPPAVCYQSYSGFVLSEPLGIMYLAAYIKKHKRNAEVSLIDGFLGGRFKEGEFCCEGISYKELKDRIAGFIPQVVGISCINIQYAKGAYDLARIVKEVSKDILVVLGGAHASAFYEEVLKDENVDLVVKGEGEETFLEIIERFEKKESLTDIIGTVTRYNGRIKLNPPRPFIKDLDQIPFPDRDLLDMGKYYNSEYSVWKAMRYPRLSMVTSRGCPFRCSFCSIHSVWCHSYRARSPENVVDEIELLCKDYGIREVNFYDDNIALDKERMKAICDEIIKRKIDIKWPLTNGVAVWTLDEETVLKMKRAGCYRIVFGLESGSRETLKFIHKEHIDFAQAKRLIRYCNKIGLWTMSSFVIGFPYETKVDVEKTLAIALDSGVDLAGFFIATPYPGTEFYDICRKEGFLPELSLEDSLRWMGELGRATCDMKYLKKEELDFLHQNLIKMFIKRRSLSFFNPFRILRKVRSLEELKYFLKRLRERRALFKDSLAMKGIY